ncbi:MAG: DEAD/DEAH box helicase [Proteiniphilum sp.]|nr:DEAD/DEAH box helicase [Proteiniphilum sp.]
MLFTDLPLCDSLLDGLQAMNFKDMTPVQEQAIPVILNRQDVIACAQTGTGKTAAFLLPLLNNLQTEPHDEHKVNAIIMAPTRELAQQIDQQMEGFSYYTPFSSVAVYGGNDGEAWSVQKRGLLSGADVVIATPGRLLSHINLYDIDFSGVKYFILDEADRMLDMGFFDDIMKLEKLLPKERQTIMFSATMPPKIQQLAKTILHKPEEISISITRPPDTILQSAFICYEPQKMGIVRNLFKEKKPKKVILFSGSKQRVKELAKTLRSMGLSAGEMHSDLDQAQRDNIMHEFRNERVDILVATDIVARGIDIDDISMVINFEVPYDVEDYVHRIGRTARAGDSGMAITFVAPDEQYRFLQIEKFLEKEVYKNPIPSELGEGPEYNPTKESGRRGVFNRSGKGARSKGGKPSGRSEKSGRSGRQGDSRKNDASPAAGTSPEEGAPNEQSAAGEERAPREVRTQGEERAPRKKRASREQRKPRTERLQGGERAPAEEGTAGEEKATGKQRAPREEGTPRKQRSPRDERAPRAEGTTGEERAQRKKKAPREGGTSDRPQKQRAPGDERTPRNQRASGTPRRQGASTPNDAVTGAAKKRSAAESRSGEKKLIVRKKTDAAQEKKSSSDKPKKWSWWPFGKK